MKIFDIFDEETFLVTFFTLPESSEVAILSLIFDGANLISADFGIQLIVTI